MLPEDFGIRHFPCSSRIPTSPVSRRVLCGGGVDVAAISSQARGACLGGGTIRTHACYRARLTTQGDFLPLGVRSGTFLPISSYTVTETAGVCCVDCGVERYDGRGRAGNGVNGGLNVISVIWMSVIVGRGRIWWWQ